MRERSSALFLKWSRVHSSPGDMALALACGPTRSAVVRTCPIPPVKRCPLPRSLLGGWSRHGGVHRNGSWGVSRIFRRPMAPVNCYPPCRSSHLHLALRGTRVPMPQVPALSLTGRLQPSLRTDKDKPSKVRLHSWYAGRLLVFRSQAESGVEPGSAGFVWAYAG